MGVAEFSGLAAHRHPPPPHVLNQGADGKRMRPIGEPHCCLWASLEPALALQSFRLTAERSGGGDGSGNGCRREVVVRVADG